MSVALAPGVEWLNECYDHGDGRHEHVGVYLLGGGDRWVMVDTGSFYHREAVVEGVREATGGDGVDAVVLSHSDYPHSANVSPVREAYGEVELVASSGAPAAQGLRDARKADIGGSLDVCGRRLAFVDPPLADRSHTTWIFDRADGVLFTADGFGAYHDPGDCARTAADYPGGVPAAAVREYHADALPWLRYVDPDAIRAVLGDIFDRFDVSWVAPAHGPPIPASVLDAHVERVVEAAADVAAAYEVPEE
ncbi:MAG: MBL fold metallo-hydrolase [Halobacteriaceae archaeon]